LRQLEPILTGALFKEIRAELVSLLNGLNEEEWRRPTTAGNWNVKDVALHIVGGDVGNLSRRRDAFSLPADLSSYEKLVAFINEINASWVTAGQRMSPRVLIDLLEHVGRQADEYFAGLDMFAMGDPVSWAGNEPMPVWFDVAREYAERWHHQQQIRDATGRLGLYEGRLFEPVMDTFVRALPWAFRDVDAADGTTVVLKLTGVLPKEWELVRSEGKWELFEVTGGNEESPQRAQRAPRQNPEAEVTIAAEDAWKIFTRGIRGSEARASAHITGELALGERLLQTVAVIA
jgi:uncharacterized protein (TIGR03083 family)